MLKGTTLTFPRVVRSAQHIRKNEVMLSLYLPKIPPFSNNIVGHY